MTGGAALAQVADELGRAKWPIVDEASCVRAFELSKAVLGSTRVVRKDGRLHPAHELRVGNGHDSEEADGLIKA